MGFHRVADILPSITYSIVVAQIAEISSSSVTFAGQLLFCCSSGTVLAEEPLQEEGH